MDLTLANLGLAFISGFGGGGVVLSGGLVRLTPGDGEDRPRLPIRRPWCHPWCPPLLGGLAAVILTAVYGDAIQAQNALLTTGVLGFIFGAAGGTSSLWIQSAMQGQQP